MFFGISVAFHLPPGIRGHLWISTSRPRVRMESAILRNTCNYLYLCLSQRETVQIRPTVTMPGLNIAQAVGGRFHITEVPVQSQGRREVCSFSLVSLRFFNDPCTPVRTTEFCNRPDQPDVSPITKPIVFCGLAPYTEVGWAHLTKISFGSRCL
jgi:hypothetical protein